MASANKELLSKLSSTIPLRPFKKSVELSLSSVGVASLPSDYVFYAGVSQFYESRQTPGTITPVPRPIDIVNEDEFTRRQGSIFTRAYEEPFCKIQATTISIIPYNIGPVQLEYYHTPATPYMDWCQATTNPNKIIYMPVGSRVYLDDALTPCLYDSNDVLLYSGVTKTGTYPITSQTVELEWESRIHEKFVYFLLTKIGLNLAEIDVAKYAIQMSNEKI